MPMRTYRLRHFFKRRPGSLFTKHSCYEEDDDGSEKASASEDIYQGVTRGGKHGLYYQCNHILIFFRVFFLSWRVFSFFISRTIGGEPNGRYGVFITLPS